ncbi:MAG TPA: UDP-3-O-(3-hydroxymyristoyl)glucosamine N-acyltransferase [Bacteroidetes bacterium]|nr:UDP-3-O-(3-hydroxymyristoyl)glucosamine N-acyltransferase [Bacteroidota bacterium]
MNLSVEEIAQLVDGEIIGNTTSLIINFNRIEHSGNGDITFFSDESFRKYFEQCGATCVIIQKNENSIPKENQVFIKVENPYFSFIHLVEKLATKEEEQKGIHHTAIINETAKVSPSASIGANCWIGANVVINDDVVLKPNVVIYDNTRIGKGTILHANSVCYQDTEIGENCIIHSGAVIGSDGFGFIEEPDGSYTKIPQIGNVKIGNNVEIGANTTIDRAFVGSTIIGDGVKLDNLVQIGHNVEIGENTAAAAQVGIAGSVKVGRRCRFGGQVGLAGHFEITDDVSLIAQSGVASSILKKGVYGGSPARDRLTYFKNEAVIHNLSQLAKDVAKIKRHLDIE